jgi:hypothetical protein
MTVWDNCGGRLKKHSGSVGMEVAFTYPCIHVHSYVH